MKLFRILDIDLDFFLNRKHTGTVTETKRLDETFIPWDEKEVRSFLESNCGLSTSRKTKGKYFVHHDEVFYYLRELQIESNFNLKFSIDHLDAHADLGTGDASYKYISSELLHQPVNSRCYPSKINGWQGLSAGNFLAFAIACQWVHELNYINKIDWVSDLQWFLFKDFTPDSNIIQLKQYSPAQMETIINGKGMLEEASKAIPLSIEPEVPFKVIDYPFFKNKECYDFVFLTQSPGFTPKTADNLIPVIETYMENIK